ncbi:MAG: transketolase [bacterium]|nr:MAG: transketolase [bacterium]
MHNVKKLSLREYYGKTLVELGRANREIVVLDADLSGSTRTSLFRKEFPDRFHNMGVSEQDMMGTAAGFATVGKIPFASTFAIFASGRAWEQIRQSICYPGLNVKIVATHGGITVGADGPSHHACEDIAVMRAIPNMTVIMPSDAYETSAAVRAVSECIGPVYIRLSREKFPVIFEESKKFRIGEADVLKKGTDATIISCGMMTHAALEAAEQLEKEGESVGILNMSTIKPLDKNALLRAAHETGALVTAEEHSIIGGLGSAVAEITAENEPVPVVRVGVKDTFTMSGDPVDLLEAYGLTSMDIVEAARKAIALKAHSERV